MKRRRYEVGTVTNGIFESDTLGNDPDVTTFETLDSAILEAETMITEWPRLTYGETLTNCAVFDSETRAIVWLQS